MMTRRIVAIHIYVRKGRLFAYRLCLDVAVGHLMKDTALTHPNTPSSTMPDRAPSLRMLGKAVGRTPKDPPPQRQVLEDIGAGRGIRTLDPNLGKVVLYP